MKPVSTRSFWAMLLCCGMLHPLCTRAETASRRVLILGDSMMRVAAHATELQLEKISAVTGLSHTSLGSGLARLDVFDWMAKIRELTAEFDPDLSIVWFGTNDYQPMRAEGRVIQPGTPEWEEEYARRVGEAMDLLTAREGARVCWLELPEMRDAKTSQDVELINRLVAQEAQKRPRAEFFGTRSILGRRPGTYSPYVIGKNGMPLQIRDPDGVHLNRAGADRLAEYLIETLITNQNQE